MADPVADVHLTENCTPPLGVKDAVAAQITSAVLREVDLRFQSLQRHLDSGISAQTQQLATLAEQALAEICGALALQQHQELQRLRRSSQEEETAAQQRLRHSSQEQEQRLRDLTRRIQSQSRVSMGESGEHLRPSGPYAVIAARQEEMQRCLQHMQERLRDLDQKVQLQELREERTEELHLRLQSLPQELLVQLRCSSTGPFAEVIASQEEQRESLREVQQHLQDLTLHMQTHPVELLEQLRAAGAAPNEDAENYVATERHTELLAALAERQEEQDASMRELRAAAAASGSESTERSLVELRAQLLEVRRQLAKIRGPATLSACESGELIEELEAVAAPPARQPNRGRQ